MKKQSRYVGTEVAFTLPDWFPPSRLDYSRNHNYPAHHAWAGSYSHSEEGNSAVEALHKLKDVGTSAVYQVCGNWVTAKFHCEPRHLAAAIKQFEDKLNRFLNRYREAKSA